ncbi:hypothetical protein CWB99_04480 [Pseudoalteromonas rubra]|uniref:Condensation domain-containing protein n=1 Tax=Pseudoalteromonas rubra TaxID=43658 RepID=A0A5S3WS76_9GAMM|nr:condensation domain-containing protein [Pseudoalteromonas rubra]TMP31514.1 hypothetical protein CWB99_04480 [Pseudoalteromonas rubra]TMP34598.1 hypothetical protein CWC00_07385 [Pseudoalteromonas rubra]
MNEIRTLGTLERKMAALHDVQGNAQTTSLLTLGQQLDEARLAKAMTRWLQLNPALMLTLNNQQDAFIEASVTGQPHELDVAEVAHDKALASLLQAVLNTPLQPQRQLCSVLLIQQQDTAISHIALTCHHALVDGHSLAYLLEQLLHCYHNLTHSERSALAPAIESQLERARGTAVPQPAHMGWPVVTQAKPAQRHTRFCRQTIEQDALVALKTIAKHSGSALNTVLTYILTQAIKQVHSTGQLRLLMAISLRQRTAVKSAASALGCLIAVSALDMPGSTDWPTFARQFDQQLAQTIDTELGYVPPMDEPSLHQLRQSADNPSRFGCDFAMTNHGVVQFDTARHGVVVREYANFANRNAGNVGIACHLATSGHRLNCVFTYCEPLMSTAMAQQINALFSRQVSAFIEQYQEIYHEAS